MKYKKNADGTDMLDENGNPIPEENTDNGNEFDPKELVTVNKQLIEEIKEMRVINAAFKKALEDKEETPPAKTVTDPEEDKIISTVEKVLEKNRSSDAQANKTAAFDKFVSEHKEFHPDNDIAGIKLQAIVKKFNVFNTSNLYSVDDFYSVIKDAHRLLVGNDKQSETYKEVKNPYSDSPTPQNSPATRDINNFSPQERKVMKEHGWSEEKFLKLKANHADMIEDLMRFVRV